MRQIRINRRHVLRAALAAPVILGGTARAAGTIQMISHRYPALEHYAEKMRGAIPGVTVNTQLMPFDKAIELATIALSSKSDTPDIVYASDTTMRTFVKNGWFRPLDDLWAKHREEFKLGDYPDAVLEPYRVDGQLYVMPHTVNSMMFFYRKDVLDKAGKAPPKTIAEYRDLAKSLNSPMRAGTINCLKPVDAASNEAHWYLNALGDGWFDQDWHPAFNTPKSIGAIEMLKEVTKYAQQGFTAAANDECMIALLCSRIPRPWVCNGPRGRKRWMIQRNPGSSIRSTGSSRRRVTAASPATDMRFPLSASRTRTRCSGSSPHRPVRRACERRPRC
jgi:ABC-type glycerol-3-phosphate transport system substrate-binding protein